MDIFIVFNKKRIEYFNNTIMCIMEHIIFLFELKLTKGVFEYF